MDEFIGRVGVEATRVTYSQSYVLLAAVNSMAGFAWISVVLASLLDIGVFDIVIVFFACTGSQ